MSSCPRCRVALGAIEHHGWSAAVCPSCHGLFTAKQDLERAIGGSGELLRRAEVLRLPRRLAPPCPRGCGPLSIRRLREEGTSLEIDVCDDCGGLWFDRGELQVIRRAGLRHQAREASAAHQAASDSADQAARQTLARAPSGDRGDGLIFYLFQLFSGLPIEGENPLYRRAVLTWGLMAACVVVFWLQITRGEAFTLALALVPSTVDGFAELLRQCVGSMFTHGSLPHLVGNLYFLWIFGDNIEDRAGRAWFLPIYVCCGLAAGIAQYASDTTSVVPVVGASGAIGGLLGAYTVLFPEVRIRIAPTILTLFHRLSVPTLVYLPFWFAWQVLAIVLGGDQLVAYWAHAGGFVMGVVLGVLMRVLGLDARVAAIARG